MLLPLLFQYQELYNSCPPVLQSEIQIISLLGGTIEISMNLIPNNLQCVIGIDTDLFYADCGKTAYCKTQQNKTNPQPGFHSSSMVSLWNGVPEQLMPTVSGVRRSTCKKSKNAISACMSTVMCCKWWTASPFFLQDWSVPVIAISRSLSSPCPDSYAWNKKVNTVRHIQRCSQNLSSLFNNKGVFEGHDANISLQSDILKTWQTNTWETFSK